MKRRLLSLLSVLMFSTIASAAAYPVKTKDNPFPGSTLFVPAKGQTLAAIVMLHGSEGGSAHFTDAEASVLATKGYQVLVLCYFDCGRGLLGPRATLKNVDVGIVSDAVSWLKKQNPGLKVGVYGFSRGAELTLIAGAKFSHTHGEPDFLVAHSPSDVFNGPTNWSWLEPACWLCKAGVGHCDESAPYSAYEWNPSCGADDPTKLDLKKSAWLVNGININASERIEIENYTKPILITVGDSDHTWPVEQTKRIEATLKNAGRLAEIVYFLGEDHHFSPANELKRKNLVMTFLKKHR